MRIAALLLMLLAMGSGCGQSQEAAPVADAPEAPAPARRENLAKAQPVIIDLGLYQIMVPYGSISGSDKFWAGIDEQVVDGQTHDLLDDNGVRVGVGSVADWSQFKKIFDAAGANTVPGHYIGPSASDQEIPASGDLLEQTLFFFDRHGLAGRVYDRCRNVLVLAYGPSPEHAGQVRVELSPMVRATRRHFSYTALNAASSVDFASDEQIYDLNLRIDLPAGKFLVVAPSAQSRRSMSIGHQFLTRDAQPGRREMILIFVANPNPVVHVGAASQMAP